MSCIGYLGIYLAIACVIVVLGNLRGMGWFRRGMDRAANRASDDLQHAKVIAGLGDNKEVQIFAGRRTHRLSIGIRALSTILTGAIITLFYNEIGNEQPLIAPPGYAVHLFFCAAFLGLLYLMFIWNYTLVVQDYELHVPRYWGGHAVHDLRTIEHMEDDGGYMLRLWFESGGKAEIIKYVEGRGQLMQVLNAYLKDSVAGIGGIRA